MKLIRLLLLAAGLAVFAQGAAAQSLSAVSLHALTAQPQNCGGCTFTWQVQIPLNLAIKNTTFDFVTPTFGECGTTCCPMVGQCAWLNQLVQHSMASWQRLCGRTDACCPAADSTGAVAGRIVAQAACCAKAGCAVEAQKCCCAKACACCETCAKPKAATCESVPYPKQVLQVSPTCPTWAPMPTPLPALARIIPVGPPSVAVPFQFARNAPVAARPQAHLVTADFDILCERMTHKGDLVLLEGNVRLTRLTQGRHLLVEAERVLFNVRDGSFTVEPDVTPRGALNILRTSAVEPMHPGVTVVPVPAGGMFERMMTEPSYYGNGYAHQLWKMNWDMNRSK